MIDKQEMMDLLVKACPSFEPHWGEFCLEWNDEPEPPLYLALADFSHQLKLMFRKGDTQTFPAVFNVIERLHREGDKYVKESVTIGILESLQIEDESPAIYEYLGPESARWWNKLDRFWKGDSTALHDD